MRKVVSVVKNVGNGRDLNEFKAKSYEKRKDFEIRIESVGGAVSRRRELPGAIAITSRAVRAPANDHPNRLMAALRNGAFIHIQTANIAQVSNVIMTVSVGSEKPPNRKAMKKPSGYFHFESGIFAAEEMDRKRKDAKYDMKTSGAK